MENIFSASTRDLMLAFKHHLMGEFPGAELKDIQPHILKAACALSASTPPVIELSHTFSTYKTTNTNQILIHENDGFAAVAARIGVQKVVVANGDYGTAPIYYYTEQSIFDATGEERAVYGLLNHSLLNLFVENDPVISDLVASYFEHTPDLVEVASRFAGTGEYSNFERFKPLFRSVAFSGKQKNQIKFEMKGATNGIAGDSGEQNVLYVELLGYKLVGLGSDVQTKSKIQGACLT